MQARLKCSCNRAYSTTQLQKKFGLSVSNDLEKLERTRNKVPTWQKLNSLCVVTGINAAQQLEDFEYICKRLADSNNKPSEALKHSKILYNFRPNFFLFRMAQADSKTDALISRLNH